MHAALVTQLAQNKPGAKQLTETLNFFMHAALVTQLAQNKPEAKQLTETHKSSLATLMMT